MIRLNIHEAKASLSRHLARLEAGEEDAIVLCRRNEPIAEIRPLPRRPKARRPIDRPDRRFKLSRRFFEPLPEELIEAFEGEPG